MSSLDLSKSESVALQEGASLTPRIKPLNALAEVFQDDLPFGSIKENLDKLEKYVLEVASAKGLSKPSSSAFSNTRGLWFEIIVAVYAWNYRIAHGLTDYYVIKMPNVKTYDFRLIFDPQTTSMLDQLEQSLRNQDSQVRLVTSNPDLLVIEQPGLIATANDPITNLSLENVDKITRLCHEIRGKCQWSSVRAGIGLKTSLRPDRRLQLVHEGNILKSIFAHLKMRHWNRDFSFEYHGASSEKHSNADDEALQTAATHTIVNVNSTPERAVDGVHSLLDTSDIYTMLDIITKREIRS